VKIFLIILKFLLQRKQQSIKISEDCKEKYFCLAFFGDLLHNLSLKIVTFLVFFELFVFNLSIYVRA